MNYSIATPAVLINWAAMHRYPIKIAALLSVFNFDEQELNDCNVLYSKDNPNECSINSIRYIILDEQDANTICNKEVDKIIESEYLYEIPAFIENYVDWDKFKADLDYSIDFIIPSIEVIDFHYRYGDNLPKFYYTQIND